MKKFLLVPMLLITIIVSAQITWTKVTELPAPARAGSLVFTLDSDLIIAGGQYDSNIAVTNEVWSYNLISSSWKKRNNLPFGKATDLHSFSSNSGFAINGKDSIYFPIKRNYRFDIINDSWIKEREMPYTLISGVNFTFKSQIYCAFPRDSNYNPTNSIWSYDTITKIWTQKKKAPGNMRFAPSCITVDSFAYFFGGSDSSNDKTISDVWKYNINQDTWVRLTDIMGKSRVGSSLFAFSNFVILAFGDYGDYSRGVPDSALSDMYKFDLKSETWTPISFSGNIQARQSGGFFVHNKKCYLYGGITPLPSNIFYRDLWSFDPAPLNPVYTDVEEVENDVEATFRLLPNPTTSQCTVRFTLPQAAEVTITISDMMGRQLATIDHSTHEQGTSFVPFSTMGYAAGLYLVRVSDGVTTTTQQLAIGGNY